MAAATLATNQSGQGIVKVFKFTAVSDTNTFAYSSSAAPKGWWVATTSSSSAAVQASWSAGTFTFKISTGSPDIALFVLL